MDRTDKVRRSQFSKGSAKFRRPSSSVRRLYCPKKNCISQKPERDPKKKQIKQKSLKKPGDCSSMTSLIDRMTRIRRSDGSTALKKITNSKTQGIARHRQSPWIEPTKFADLSSQRGRQSSADLLRPSDGSTALKKIVYYENPKPVRIIGRDQKKSKLNKKA